MIEALKSFSIDKSDWMPVKFGDVVYEPKESVKDPAAAGIEHVVGLEHIDSEDIHLRRSASIEDGTTFTKKFDVGDVLFGRRRAYLKKAAKADFSGICSGDIIVMRAKDNLLPKLLPFIVNNDKFFDFAIKHSAGGLSPRVKFKNLAEYEFRLPPKSTQTRLAELLWASNEQLNSRFNLAKAVSITFKSKAKRLIEQGVDTLNESKSTRFGSYCMKWELLKISDFCEVVGGNAFKSARFKPHANHQVIRIGNVTPDGFNFDKTPVFIQNLEPSEERFLIPCGAIVVSLTGTNGKRDYGHPTLMRQQNKYLLNQRLAMIFANRKIMLPEFLLLLSKMEFFQGAFFLNATGTANQANVSISDVLKIKLPVPQVSEQRKIVNVLEKIRLAKSSNEAAIEKCAQLEKFLIDQVF